MTQHVDYYVRLRDEDELVDRARRWRREAELVLSGDYFNMVDFVKKVLQRDLVKRDPLEIAFLPKDAAGPVAKVSFEPFRLSVNVLTWAAARAGDHFARYVLAHETGHVVLHDNTAKGFSEATTERIPASNRISSAEWQADVFADHLLAPLHIVSRYRNAEEVAIRCGVPTYVAIRQLERVPAYWEREGQPYGCEPCENCLSYDTWVLDGRVRCRSCMGQNSIRM